MVNTLLYVSYEDSAGLALFAPVQRYECGKENSLGSDNGLKEVELFSFNRKDHWSKNKSASQVCGEEVFVEKPGIGKEWSTDHRFNPTRYSCPAKLMVINVYS